MPGQGVLLNGRNGLVVKTFEEIVLLVVLAHVIETEIKILTLELPTARRPVRSSR
jgi:hypothetical protein